MSTPQELRRIEDDVVNGVMFLKGLQPEERNVVLNGIRSRLALRYDHSDLEVRQKFVDDVMCAIVTIAYI